MIYLVIVRDTASHWTNVESAHGSREGAEDAKRKSELTWGVGTILNPPRYTVRILEMTLEG